MRYSRMLKAGVLAATLILMVWGIVAPAPVAAGSCSGDCGCSGGNTLCCDLPNGARCYTKPPV